MKYLLGILLLFAFLPNTNFAQAKVESQGKIKAQKKLKAKTDVALLEAIEKGNAEAFYALLRANADVNAMYKSGATALMIAAICDRLEFLKELIRRGADVNAIDEYGNTALIYAAIPAEVDLVETLLIAGAGVKTQNKNGYTALKCVLESPYAAWDDYQKVAELLRAYGAEK